MRLYLVRHGHAVEASVNGERPLSDKGQQEARDLARFGKRISLCVPAIWHSNKLRALQTAQCLQQEGGMGGKLVERDGLSPNDDVATLGVELMALEDDACIVGHLPYISRLASHLLARDEAAFAWGFDSCAMACLERESTGRWRLRWFVVPSMLT